MQLNPNQPDTGSITTRRNPLAVLITAIQLTPDHLKRWPIQIAGDENRARSINRWIDAIPDRLASGTVESGDVPDILICLSLTAPHWARIVLEHGFRSLPPPAVQESADRSWAADRSCFSPDWILALIDYFRATLDYRFMETHGLGWVTQAIRHWLDKSDLSLAQVQCIQWSIRFCRRLMNVSRSAAMISKIGLNPAELTTWADRIDRFMDQQVGQSSHDNNLIVSGRLQTESPYGQFIDQAARLELTDDELCIQPQIPDTWQHCAFQILYRGSRIEFWIDHQNCRIDLKDGSSQALNVDGIDYLLEDRLIVPVVKSSPNSVEPQFK